MAVIQVDTNESEDLVYVTGNIEKITSNRRAMRLLKDNAVFTIKDDCLEFDVGDDLTKCINRIKTAAKYAQCDVEIKGNANSGIQAYYEEEQNFANFSKKALDIRNNDCDIEEFKKFKDSLIDNMQNRTLYELQMLAAYHLAFSQNACNFSVPGAGKTSVVYGAYAYLHNLPEGDTKKVDRILIISPLNAFAPWELEYEECFGRKPTSKRLSGKLDVEEKKQYLYEMNPAEITLVSYASVISLVDELTYFLKKHRVMVILDEAHKIKNTKGGVISQSIMALAENCKSRVVLTGTPAPNGYEDLFNLFKFIWPTKNIIKYHIGQLRDMSKTVDDPRVDSLLDTISPYFIRIKKGDLGIPPAINHPPVQVEMKPSQRKIYDFIEKQYISDIAKSKDLQVKSELIKARMIRLMQAATNPALLAQPLKDFAKIEDVDFDGVQDDSEMFKEILKYSTNEIPAKYEKAKEIIEKIISDGGKVIVWACYIKNIELLKEYLEGNGIPVRTLYGATPIAGDDISEEDEEYSLTREAIVKEFHNPDSSFKVIIANPFAVSESISLHKACHNAIYLERSFNAAHFLQSKDRIHRYGLKEGTETNYYYLVSNDSVDGTVHQRLIDKERRLMEIIESMPIPLFDNFFGADGDEDIKAVLRDYAKRTKTL
ncbi:MAG: DEAD/DEAH box helicase [Lachnospiraceae bacterium]|nr:DEAD/DEAH box helicase [Lachnospiraceae bacterium]